MTFVYNGSMAQTNSERQRAFQQRKAARVDRMEAALKEVITVLDGNEKPLAVKVREIAARGLA